MVWVQRKDAPQVLDARRNVAKRHVGSRKPEVPLDTSRIQTHGVGGGCCCCGMILQLQVAFGLPRHGVQ